MLWLQTTKSASGTMNLGGSLTRQVRCFVMLGYSSLQLINCNFFYQVEKDCQVNEANPHIVNIGHLVEDMENKIRNTLNNIYFDKTRDIVNSLR